MGNWIKVYFTYNAVEMCLTQNFDVVLRFIKIYLAVLVTLLF